MNPVISTANMVIKKQETGTFISKSGDSGIAQRRVPEVKANSGIMHYNYIICEARSPK